MPKAVNHVEAIVEFVLEQVEDKPSHVRIKMYRALAHICGKEDESTKLNQMADTLESAELQAKQFKFDFSNK